MDPIQDTRVIMDEFENSTDELHYHLARAEHHARAAHDLLFKPEGPKRSMWFRMLTGRAQSILIGLYVQELSRKKR